MPAAYDHYKKIPNLPAKISSKKKKPKIVAVVDEDNCTGCQACVTFCPVDCIEPVPQEKYDTPIPPVQIRFNECIGCSVCARVCEQLAWYAIDMIKVPEFESEYGIQLTDGMDPPYGVTAATPAQSDA